MAHIKYIILLLLTCYVAQGWAKDIIVDTKAPAANQATLDQAPNNVPIVNITRPNAGGVSHNKFHKLNVPTQGAIMNNSTVVGTSQLGGMMTGNPNFKGTAATIILNEVTSTHRSQLLGTTEIFGTSAEYILANPNGITCNGCGFINTPRVAFITGTPHLHPEGTLDHFDVNGGDIRITGTTANLANVSRVDLITRQAEILQEIQAGGELTIQTGRNIYHYNSNTVTKKLPDGSTKPVLAIDTAVLGGMYAGKIILIATEEDVGIDLKSQTTANANDLELTADGKIRFKHLSAKKNIAVLSKSSDIEVAGNSNAGQALTLTADNGTITFEKDTTSGAKNTVTIQGQNIYVQQADVIAGLNNTGNTIQNGILTMTASNSLTNTGLIASGNTLTLLADTITNGDPNELGPNPADAIILTGTIAALNDILLGGLNGTKATTINNLSSLIESYQGNVTINATELNNKKKRFTTKSSITFNQSYGGTVSSPGCNNVPGATISPEGCAYMQGSLVKVPHPTRDNYDAYYNTRTGAVPVTVQLHEKVVDTDSPKASIFAGKSMTLNTTTLNNDHSEITATENLEINGTKLINSSTILTSRQTHSIPAADYRRCFGGVCRWFEWNTAVTVESGVTGNVSATIFAGGDITGTLEGEVDNVSVVEFANEDAIHQRSHNYVTAVQASSDIPDGEIGTLSFTNAIPGASKFFTKNPDNPNYVHETRFRFTDAGTFYGSQYFMKRMNLNPNEVFRRIGDEIYETKLIATAVLDATAKRWLASGPQDDVQQMKALLDNAVDLSKPLQLTFGIALSPEQMASLTQDIVWYVEEEFEGETVLVPRLYLADASRMTLTPQGSLIAADNIDLTAGTLINHNSTIEASNDLSIAAFNHIINHSGTLKSGQDMTLTAETGSIINSTETRTEHLSDGDFHTMRLARGRIQSGGNLVLTANQDILARGADISATGDAALTAGNTIELATITRQSRRSASGGDLTWESQEATHEGSTLTTGGNLTMTALGDITLRASSITATGSAELQAAGDLTLATAKNSRYYQYSSEKNTGSTEYEGAKRHHLRSSITAAGDLSLASGQDLTLEAATLTTEQELSIEALGDIDTTVVKDSSYERLEKERNNRVWFSMLDQGHHIETVQHTEMQAATAPTIQAGGTLRIEHDIDKSIHTLAQSPEFAWLKSLENNPHVDYQGVKAAFDTWNHEASGLTAEAAAVIAIAVTVATYGAGANGAGAALLGTTGTTTTAMANAAIATIASQASVSMISNQGDLGAVLQELSSEESIKAVAFAVATAGAVEGLGGHFEISGISTNKLDLANHIKNIGINTGVNAVAEAAIYGEDFGEALVDNFKTAAIAAVGAEISGKIGIAKLDKISNKIAHAALGCAMGSAGGGGCASGAAGAVTAEFVAELYADNKIASLRKEAKDLSKQEIEKRLKEIQKDSVLAGKLSALGTAFLSGADTEGINIAHKTGSNAVENNFACGGLCIAGVAIALASISLTAYDVHDVYQKEGAEAALEQLAKDGAITVVATVTGTGALKLGSKVYKVAGKKFTNADEAWGFWSSSKGIISTNIPSIGKKYNQLKKRGWSSESIDELVNNPHTTRKSVNKTTGNNATVFYRKDGHHVVRDDITGDLVQMSDTKIPIKNWVPDSQIINPYNPR